MADDDDDKGFWAVVELFGHQRAAGYVREVEFAGAGFVRLDVPGEGEEILFSTVYNPKAIYSVTAVGEAEAREVARSCNLSPLRAWEARRALGPHQAHDDGSVDIEVEYSSPPMTDGEALDYEDDYEDGYVDDLGEPDPGAHLG